MKAILFLLILLLIPSALALEKSIYLLAISEGDNEGSLAEISLEIRKGDGKILLDTPVNF